MSFLSFATVVQDWLWILENRNYLWDARNADQNYILENWAPWLRFMSLEQTVQCFSVIRVFLDSIIILIVLTGYRENAMGFLKAFILIFMRPKTTFQNLKRKFQRKIAKVSFGKTAGNLFTKRPFNTGTK